MAKTNRQSFTFDWADLAFGSKKPLRELKATFLAAPRELSQARFTQLVKIWLPKGNLVVGLAKEEYIEGFDGQPHFRTLQVSTIQSIIDKVNSAKTPHKIYSLSYFQRELPYILEKVPFTHYLFINGSWHKTFHTLPAYYILTTQHSSYELVSPFVNEVEAKAFTKKAEINIERAYPLPKKGKLMSEAEMMDAALLAANYSFDYAYQNGLALGQANKGGYRFLTTTHNAVVPFQGYALHHGSSRERHFSPPHDLNYYDTVHAEVDLVIQAAQDKIDLRGGTVFISTLPCPTCSRMFCRTGIRELVYENDHSDGYGLAMLEAAGKTVRRVVSAKKAHSL